MAQKPRPRKVTTVPGTPQAAPVSSGSGLSAGTPTPPDGMFDSATGLTLPHVARANDGGRFRQYPQFGQLSRSGLLSVYGTPIGDGKSTSMRVYNPDTISLAEYDEMALYPVIRSCLLGYSLVMQTADYSVSCPDASMKALIESQFLPIIPQIMQDMLMPMFTFGWADGEQVWETRYNVPVEVDGVSSADEGDPLNPAKANQDLGNATVSVFPFVTALKDVIPINNTTVTLRQTPQGEFAGLIQYTWGEQFIPPSKLLHIPLGGMFRNPYGQAMTKPCYPFWYWTRFLFEMGMVGVKRGAAPPIIGYAPPTKITAGTDSLGRPVTVDAADYMMQQLLNLRSFATAVFPKTLDANGKDLYSVEELPLDLHVDWVTEFIDLCNKQMMLGMFWPDKLLQGGDVGSYALAKEHTDLFSLAVKALLDVVLRHITNGPLKQFVRFNDRNAPDATLTYGAPNIEAMQALSQSVVQAIVSGQALVTQNQDKVLVPDWRKLADDLGIPYSIVRRSDGRDAFGNPLQPGMDPDAQDHAAAQNGGQLPQQQPGQGPGAPGGGSGQYQGGFNSGDVPPATPGYNTKQDQIAFAEEIDEADPYEHALSDSIDAGVILALASTGVTTGPTLGGTGAFHTGGTHRVPGPSASNPAAHYHYEPGPAAPGQYITPGGTVYDHNLSPLSQDKTDILNHLAEHGRTHFNHLPGSAVANQTHVPDLDTAGYVNRNASGDVSLTYAGFKALRDAGAQFKGDWTDSGKNPVGNLIAHALSSPAPTPPSNESSEAQRAFSAADEFERVLNVAVGHGGTAHGTVVFSTDRAAMAATAKLRNAVSNLKTALVAANQAGNTQLAGQLKAECDHYSYVRDVLIDAASRGRGALVTSPVGGSIDVPDSAATAQVPGSAAPAAGSAPTLTADEQKVVSYLAARHAKNPGVAVHFDSIRAAAKIPQAQLRTIIDGLETNGHLAKHASSAWLRTGLSKYSLTGSAATPQATAQPATVPAAPAASAGANTGAQAATPPATQGATAPPVVTPVQQNSIQHHILHTLAASGPSGLSFTQLAPSVRASSGASGKIGGLITSLTNQGHISYSNFSGGQYHITPQGAAAIANHPNPQPLPAGTTVNAPAPQTAIAPGSTEHHYLYNIASVTQSGPVSLTTFNQVQNVAHGNTPGVTVSPNVVTQLQNAGLVAVNNGMLSVTPAGHAALAQLPAINYHSTGNGWSLGGTPNAAHQPAPPSPPAAPAAATTPATGNPINLTPGTPHYRVMIGISNSPYGRLAAANPLIANNQTEVNDLLAAGYLHDLNGMGYRLTPAGTAALSAAVPVSGHVHGAPSPAATQPATPATPAPTAPQPPAAQHVAGTSVSVTPDEQKVIAYLTGRHAKKPGVHIHFDSIKAATKIPQSQLAPLIDGLEQKGLLVKHPGSAGKRTGLSSYVLTGAAASSAMTPHATGGGTTAPVTPAQATPGNNTAASAPPANPYDDAFNAPPVGGYVVGPNSSFIHWGAAAGGGLPGAPVHALAVRAGRSTLPLNLDDPGPADGSQPRLDAQQYPDRNHAAAFGMTYQGPTGGIVTAIHGTDNRALLGGTVSGLRPGDTNAYGFGLYTWADSINHSQASYYTKGTNFVLEMHTGQCVHDTNTPALVQRFRNEHPTQYNALSHDNAKVTAAACLQYGYTTIVRDYGSRGSSPSYICLDPSRCRIKAVVDNSGKGLKLPNGKKSADAPDIMKPPTAKVQGRQYVPQGAWFGTPDLAAVKDPRLVARNKAIGADPNVPLSDNGYNAIVEIGKHAPASMVTKSRVDQARDVTRLVLPVRSAGSPESLTSILEDGELISAAELKARHQAAQSDPTSAGQALAAKYGAAIAAAPNNPVDPVLGLDKSVLMTYGGPTPYSTYGDYAMVFKKEVLNTPGAKVGIHSPNAYNGNSMGAAGVSNLNVDEWNKHEIDGAEADEVMAYQLAAGFPVTQATKTRVTHGNMPQNGMLSNPTDYIDGHNLRASELSEVHIPTSVSAHHISHILIPSGRRYQPDQDKAGNQNAVHDHWNVAPGLHDSLKGRFSTFDAGTFASLNPHLANDGQKISLDGLPLTMRKVSTPAGRSSWKFEVPAQASRSVPLKQHLEDLCKRKGLDIKIVETNHGRNGNPHKVNGKSAYAQICYQQL